MTVRHPVVQESKEKEERLRQKREAERQMKLKAEEKDKWWRGAELMYGDRGSLIAQDEALTEAHKCTTKVSCISFAAASPVRPST